MAAARSKARAAAVLFAVVVAPLSIARAESTAPATATSEGLTRSRASLSLGVGPNYGFLGAGAMFRFASLPIALHGGIGSVPLENDAILRAASMGLRFITTRTGNLETFVGASYMTVVSRGINPFGGIFGTQRGINSSYGRGVNAVLGIERVVGRGPGFYACADAGITILDGSTYPALDVGLGASF